MSSHDQLFETLVIASPNERVAPGVYDVLPLHLNVVDPFIASKRQVARLMSSIVKPKVFEVTGFEHADRGSERIQRLGGSVLHNIHDDIITSLDRLHIIHDNTAWEEGTTDTWYSGTWQVPQYRTKITQLHVAQEMPDEPSWQILRSYNLQVPSDDFRQDPLYLDSLYNPVHKRRAS